MPSFHLAELKEIGTRILEAAGVSADDADVIATELADANLVGHDSHGIIRLMQYVQYIDQGHIKPGSPFEVVKEVPSFAIVDGHFHFGQVTATKALNLGLEKARETGTATVVIRNCNHIGRLGSYSQKAAQQGFGAMMFVNAPGPGGVAPYGGIDRRLGTNPISMAAPRGDEPLVLDMTSSATAEGKVRVALQKGEQVSEGWIIDHAGNPSTNPADLYADENGDNEGAILPLGGNLGFKGYGLSVMIDFFAGMLSGSGVCRTDVPRGANGVWLYLADLSQFVEQGEYDALIEKYAGYMKSSRRVPGTDEILLPGEIELRRRKQREADGVDVADETWRQLNELAEGLGTSLAEIKQA